MKRPRAVRPVDVIARRPGLKAMEALLADGRSLAESLTPSEVA